MNTTREALEAQLDAIAAVPDNDWMDGLTERKRRELEFHDAHRDRTNESVPASVDQDTYEKFYGNKKYYKATGRSREYTIEWIKRHAEGKVFLDYACGNGENAILAAKSGAELAIGLDISATSVENAAADAEAQNVSANTRFIQADAENTLLPDNSIDAIICSGMLHHLDLSYAYPELRRILKPGGKLLAVEALDYNPAIKLYRRLTPQMRTEWEKAHILSLKDVGFGTRFLTLGEVRYWHIVGILTPHLERFAGLLERIDRLFERIPYFQRMAWIFTFELIKGEEPSPPRIEASAGADR